MIATCPRAARAHEATLIAPCALTCGSPRNPLPSTFHSCISCTAQAAAEETGFTFLPCILSYLHRAPAIIPPSDPRASRAIWASDVDAVVVPANAAGAPAAMHKDS